MGLEVPNFQHYYFAVQLQYFVKLIQNDNHNNSWIEFNKTNTNIFTSVSDLPILTNSIKKMSYFKTITISSTLTAWWKAIQMINSSLAPCKYTPIWYNPDLKMYNIPIYLPTWHLKGITFFCYLFRNNKFI